MAEGKPATLLDVKKYFEYETASQFTSEWKALTETDQNELKQGLTDGSYNY